MLQHEVDRNQDLLGRIKKLEERETEAAKHLSEQVEANRALRKNLEGLNKKLEERDTRLNTANQVPTHRLAHRHTYTHTFVRPCLLSYVDLLLKSVPRPSVL